MEKALSKLIKESRPCAAPYVEVEVEATACACACNYDAACACEHHNREEGGNALCHFNFNIRSRQGTASRVAKPNAD